jgi:tetratricopeptide (TPR) repeat protein
MSTEHKHPRMARSQKIREAEGYLELITLPAARLGLDARLRRQGARKILRLVARTSVNGSDRWRRDLLIGQAYRLLKKYSAAVGPLWSAVQSQPESREGWIALGWCLKRMGKLDRAASVLARAVTHIPDDAVLHFNFACYLARLGQDELAIAELLWALDLNPDIRMRLVAESDFDSLRGNSSFQALTQTTV